MIRTPQDVQNLMTRLNGNGVDDFVKASHDNDLGVQPIVLEIEPVHDQLATELVEEQ